MLSPYLAGPSSPETTPALAALSAALKSSHSADGEKLLPPKPKVREYTAFFNEQAAMRTYVFLLMARESFWLRDMTLRDATITMGKIAQSLPDKAFNLSPVLGHFHEHSSDLNRVFTLSFDQCEISVGGKPQLAYCVEIAVYQRDIINNTSELISSILLKL